MICRIYTKGMRRNRDCIFFGNFSWAEVKPNCWGRNGSPEGRGGKRRALWVTVSSCQLPWTQKSVPAHVLPPHPSGFQKGFIRTASFNVHSAFPDMQTRCVCTWFSFSVWEMETYKRLICWYSPDSRKPDLSLRYERNKIALYFPKRIERKQNPPEVKYEAFSLSALPFALLSLS